jgi:hypothetical protein
MSPNGQNKSSEFPSKDDLTMLKTRDATSLMATFVGVQTRVLQFLFSRAKSKVPKVLVFPVPGGPQIRSIVDL